MGNEFSRNHPVVTHVFTIANVDAGTTPVDGILAGTNAKNGFIVPTGYKYVPIFMDVEYNATITEGTSTVKVTDNGTEVAKGPEPVVTSSGGDLTDTDLVTGDPISIAAGHEVGVSATGDGTFAPTTADADVVLYGYFLPG